MRIERFFLGWEKPFLASYMEHLFTALHSSESAQETAVVLPSRRAGRILLEMLSSRTDTVPQVITPGEIDLLLFDERAASPQEARWAWEKVLSSSEGRAAWVEEYGQELTPVEVSAVAERCCRVWESLAANGCSLLDCIGKTDERSESRWQMLQFLRDKVNQELEAVGLVERHERRLRAFRSPQSLSAGSIHLCAVLDLPAVLCRLLQSSSAQISSFIFAPESDASRFDQFGCLLSTEWKDRFPTLPLEQIYRCADEQDQAERMVEATSESNRSLSQSTVGVLDPVLHGFIEAECADRQLAYHGAGVTAPVFREASKLCSVLADLLGDWSFAAFRELVRHDWTSALLALQAESREEQIAALDRMQEEELLFSITEESRGALPEKLQPLITLLGVFDEEVRALPDWLGRLREFLKPLPEMEEGPLSPLRQEFESWSESFSHAPSELFPKVRCRTALLSFARRLESVEGGVPAEDDALEGLGWLEVLLDPAPSLSLVGCNEGVWPSRSAADQFLPNTLRERLGLTTEADRWARDCYLLTALSACKKDLKLFFGERNLRGEFLRPSAFLYSTERDLLAERFFALRERADRPVGRNGSEEEPREWPPAPVKGLSCSPLHVTSFRDYIQCPYRFYLKHVLKLKRVDDDVQELSPAQFGTILHEVLAAFGRSPLRNSDESDAIIAFLLAELEKRSARRLAEGILPAVPLQIERMRRRLIRFGAAQAGWRKEGWEIRDIEKRCQSNLTLEGTGTVSVVGRIDRVDYHPRTQRWLAFDYKSAEKGSSPEAQHGGSKGRAWRDLQLPLYEWFLRKEYPEGEIDLAYWNLPGSEKSAGPQEAAWSAEERKQAIEYAAVLAQQIQDQIFWPPTEELLPFDDFAELCGVGQFERLTAAEGGDER